MRVSAAWVAIVLTLSSGFRPALAAPVWLPGFIDEPYVGATFVNPTAIALLPGGRLLVTEKVGRLWAARDSVKTLMWSHTQEINANGDRGLLGVAVDPHFDQNRFIYLAYTVSPDSTGDPNDNGNTFGRLTRYQVSATDSNTLDESTRTVLIGATWGSGFPAASTSHTADDLHWGADGTLLVAAGEGAHFGFTDPGGSDPIEFLPGHFDPEQNVGAFRALDLLSLGGKVLRVDPTTGFGLRSNPYFDGDSTTNQSRVWLYGLRNPFRFCVKPGTGAVDPALGQPGTLYIADVGWNTFEEVDVARASGVDYGWPCFEGFIGNNTYQLATPSAHGCDTFGNPDNPRWPTRPIIEFHHSDPSLSTPPGTISTTVIGGTFYAGAQYPPTFQGGYFFGDYSMDWIKVAFTDALDHLISVQDFGSATNGPVCFLNDPATGDIVYVAIYTGQVRRIRYEATVSVVSPPSPVIALSAAWPNPSAGAVTLALDLPAPARIEWSVLDAAGRRVWHAPAREASAGRTPLLWTGIGEGGVAARPGVYLARVTVDGRTTSRRFALLR